PRLASAAMKTMRILPGAVLLALSLGAALPLCAAAEPVESEIEAAVGNGPLRGTLPMPADGAPRAAVVVVPGSGPTDRDGNSPLGVDASYLKMLADALAAQGVAAIRIDKRGLFGSKGTFL